MRKILLEITDELAAAIDHARGKVARNPAIEAWLWRVGELRDAAKKLGLPKPKRTTRGRPKHAD